MLELGEGTYRHARGGGVVLRVEVETRRSHPSCTWLVYLADFSWQAWNSKTVFWASCPYSYWMGRRLSQFLLNRSASILVADRVIFPESETDPVILPLEALLFLPLVLKLGIYFLFFHGYRGLLWSGLQWLAHTPHHCAVFSQPGVFLALCCLWGIAPPKALCTLCLLCRKQWFFQTCHGFGLTLRLCDYHLMPVSLTVLWSMSPSSADDGNTRARHVTGA